VEEYFTIATKHDLSLTQMSLAFVNMQEFVTSNIIGATSLDQLKENIDSVNLELTDEVLEDINKIHENNPSPAP
jgi:aryl-alcohol dehydrogenase-like predicted oxidoreductase